MWLFPLDNARGCQARCMNGGCVTSDLRLAREAASRAKSGRGRPRPGIRAKASSMASAASSTSGRRESGPPPAGRMACHCDRAPRDRDGGIGDQRDEIGECQPVVVVTQRLPSSSRGRVRSKAAVRRARRRQHQVVVAENLSGIGGRCASARHAPMPRRPATWQHPSRNWRARWGRATSGSLA